MDLKLLLSRLDASPQGDTEGDAEALLQRYNHEVSPARARTSVSIGWLAS